VTVEAGFALRVDPGDGGAPIFFNGRIDRIDRHPDGSIEVIDYKTGRTKTQREVDADDQLSAYALALRDGAVPDPETGDPLPAPARVTLYFTEEDLALSTTRTDAQLDEYRDRLVETVLRIRSGDFAATPGWEACGRCDYARICPNRFREGDL
jgi:DNA helicase-2/ATP-dependent DNA helicase PcrA